MANVEGQSKIKHGPTIESIMEFWSLFLKHILQHTIYSNLVVVVVVVKEKLIKWTKLVIYTLMTH